MIPKEVELQYNFLISRVKVKQNTESFSNPVEHRKGGKKEQNKRMVIENSKEDNKNKYKYTCKHKKC